MGFNYGKERRKFEAEWTKLREQYRKVGFPEKDIAAMYAFDLEIFRQQRRFENHNQPLPREEIHADDPDTQTLLFARFDSLTAFFDEGDFAGRFAWIESISDPRLTYRLKQLKHSDLELLTLFAIEGYSQTEIAKLHGCSQKNISLKITRIKKFLMNY